MRKHHIYGGDLKDVPLPWIRLFDDKRRHRCVTARVWTWVGITSGAEHYYARIREEDDPIWDISHWVYYTRQTSLAFMLG